MNRSYIATMGPESPLLTAEGGINLDVLFKQREQLKGEAQSSALLDELLGHVTERWLANTTGTPFSLTGIFWATKQPMNLPDPMYSPVIPVGLDLQSDDIEKMARILLTKPEVAESVGESMHVDETLKALEQIGPIKDREGAARAIAVDGIVAMMGADLMKMGARDTAAVAATVIGLTQKIDTRDQSIESGLLCYHEHIATGSKRLWCKGETRIDSRSGFGGFVSFGEWTSLALSEFDDHPIMKKFTDMLPMEAYCTPGVKGGEA